MNADLPGEIAPYRSHCYCWLNAEQACCNCGDDGDGSGDTSDCRSDAHLCLSEPTVSVVYMVQWRPDGSWVDLLNNPLSNTLDGLNVARRVALQISTAPVRVVERTTVDRVLP